jgi:hypothetical protein
MTQEELFQLQVAYGRAVYESERWRKTVEVLQQRLNFAAELAAGLENAEDNGQDRNV